MASSEQLLSNDAQLNSLIFECTFDDSENSDCGSQINSTNTTFVHIVGAVRLPNNETITDVRSTSIESLSYFVLCLYFNFNFSLSLSLSHNEAKPAFNGEKCVIPFLHENIQHYHCTDRFFECLTESGKWSRCTLGNFFFARSSLILDEYMASMTFPSIQLPEDSHHYEIRFYNLFSCGFGCSVALDEMSVRIRDTDTNELILSKSYMQNDFKMENRWIKRELRFEVANASEVILEFEFSRAAYFDQPSFFMIDNIELIVVNSDYSSTELNNSNSTTSLEIEPTTENVSNQETTTYPIAENVTLVDTTTGSTDIINMTNETTVDPTKSTAIIIMTNETTVNPTESTAINNMTNETSVDPTDLFTITNDVTTHEIEETTSHQNETIHTTDLIIDMTTNNEISIESTTNRAEQNQSTTSSSSSSSSTITSSSTKTTESSSSTTSKEKEIVIITTSLVIYIVGGVLGLIVLLLIILIAVVCKKKNSSRRNRVLPESFKMRRQ